ncbi:MAG: DinB family protein [Balneolaceae bacterium]|nr:DinB family protein [Balneolaceae bacterium]
MNSIWDNIKLKPGEYGDFYQGYIDQVGSGNVIEILKNQMQLTYTLINSLSYEQSHYRYAKGKWSVLEVIGHLIDAERVFAYRALRFSRNDDAELPGFDQDQYIDESNYNSRSKQSLGNEYRAVRNASVHLFSGFTEGMLMRKGVANEALFTARSIPFIIAGHERHHLALLKTNYGLDFHL